MNNNDIPVWEKYTLTIEEASKYFRIGENKLRRLAEVVMIFSVFSTVGIIPLGICFDAVSEDTDWITFISQDLILPLMIRTKSHSLP